MPTVTSPSPPPPAQAADPAAPVDPGELLRSRNYIVLLVLGAVVGAPIAAAAYFFLKAINKSQTYLFSTMPGDVGFSHEPLWWPIPFLVLGGLLVGLTIRYLPGTAGHKPAEGLKTAGATRPIDLPGIVIAAFATLSLGAVLGPEAPLIAMGSGLGVLAVYLLKRDAPAQAATLVGVAGSFAAVSTLLGSPLTAAFLLMEAAGLGGAMLGVILVPGLLAAGIGTLIFVGLNNWTGYGTQSLGIPNIPPFGSPTGAEFLWAIGIGVGAALVGTVIRRGALLAQPVIEQQKVLLTPVLGLVVALSAIVFAETTDKSSTEVLFSGQSALPGLIEGAATWTAGALVLLAVCKGVAYAASLSGFRGGPVFPGMFIGAAAGIALSHLPGLPMIAGAAMGIGALTTVMLRLPFTAVLLTTLFLSSDGIALMPLVIVAVVVAYVITARLEPAPAKAAEPDQAAQPEDAAAPPESEVSEPTGAA
jgi:H+/Cl- antiporter ClcA